MQKPVTTGEMKWRIRFDKRVEINPAEGGGTVTAWSVIGTGSFVRSAAIRPQRGGESNLAGRLQGQQPNLIFVRRDMNTKNIDPTWRAVELVNGTPVRFFDIRDAGDMERDSQFITILAVLGGPDGGDDPTPVSIL